MIPARPQLGVFSLPLLLALLCPSLFSFAVFCCPVLSFALMSFFGANTTSTAQPLLRKQEPVLRNQYCGTSAAEPVLRKQYCGTSTAEPVLRNQYCGTSPAEPVLRNQYCGTSTAEAVLRNQYCATSSAAPVLRNQYCGTRALQLRNPSARAPELRNPAEPGGATFKQNP